MKKWITKNTKEAFRGLLFRYLTVERESADSGKIGTFDVLQTIDWVNLIALDEKENVILVKQYRHGNDEITLEIPGGGVHPGEDPLLGAKRELREETGHESDEWHFLGKVSPNPAFMGNYCYTYLAKNCIEVGELQLDPLEEIDVVKIPLKEINSKLKSGEIDHSLVVSAFKLYDLF